VGWGVRRFRLGAAAVVVTAVAALVAACSGGGPSRPQVHYVTSSPTTTPTPPAIPAHGGVDLNVLVVTDGSTAVQAVRQQLMTEGLPITVLNLKSASRQKITRSFLARTLPGGSMGGNFEGVVVPGATFSGLSSPEKDALAWYEQKFKVRQVDAYSPPMPSTGMGAPVYSGLLTGDLSVTTSGAAAGFSYLKGSFPFSGGLAGPAAFGYLADPLPGAGATPLIQGAIPGSSGKATLVWQYDQGGREQLGIGFGYVYTAAQFRYLGHGIVTWLTRGINLGDWRNYLDIAYDDMFLGDSQWSIAGKCTPGVTKCPKGTPMTGTIRMVPADVSYAVNWEKQHDFTIELLYNGGASARFATNGVDALLVATKPVAQDFYWVNHTWTHAYFGCKQDFSVTPWQCVKQNGTIVWAAGPGLINSQILQNFAWAKQNGIPYEPGVVASGEYSGLPVYPQQPVDNPSLDAAMGPDGIKWIVMDASVDPDMRYVGAALGVPRHPIDIGEDVDTVAEEVSEFNWYNTSKADGGSGVCQGSKVTKCLTPLSLTTGWLSTIVPTQSQIVFNSMINNDPRPFFMHQSNLTGDRLGYPVMDAILSAYRAVYGTSAPIENLPTNQDGTVLHDQQLWATAQRENLVSAWVQGNTVTISGPAGTTVPLTVPDGTTVGGAAFGSAYSNEMSGYTTLGAKPFKLTLSSAPFGG
jgi:hypothetical protein